MSKYLLFLDESGDHGLKTIDPNFPVFVLTGVLFAEENYRLFCKQVDAFKQKFFGNKEVILHRRDMRKYEKGFEILFDPDIKRRFYTELNELMRTVNYKIISSVIDKQKHIDTYGKLADDPYEIALTFVMERTLFEADEKQDATNIHVTIEGRGPKEDAQLAKRYNELLYRGTGKVASNRLLRVFNQELEVRLKRDNDCGLQLADLCAYPIARFFMNNNEPNPAYDVIKNKIRKGPRGVIGYGVKLFP